MPRRWLLTLALVAGACSSGASHATAPATTRTAPGPPVPTSRHPSSTTTRPGPPVRSPGAGTPCGWMSRPPVRYAHVVWIWMENRSYDAVVGSPSAPYINYLAARCGLATNYHNITHPSLPNYLAATSGLSEPAVRAFASDCDPSPSCRTPAASIFGQGETWKAFVEAMPAACDGRSGDRYAARHNPPLYYSSLSGCAARDLPFSALAADLSGAGLPAFSFITPDLADDMHDGTVSDGDNWLGTHLPALLDSPDYRRGTVAVFITWDEGEGGAADDCALNPSDAGCHVATLVISPSTRAGTRSATRFSHWSLLRTAEDLLHLPLLGHAATATTMVPAFNL